MTGDQPSRPQPRGHGAERTTDAGSGHADTSLGQAITRYLESARLSPDARATHRSTLLRFAFHAGLDVPLNEVPRDVVDDFLWTSQSHGGATLAADVIALRSFKRWCGTHELSARGIAAGLRGRP